MSYGPLADKTPNWREIRLSASADVVPPDGPTPSNTPYCLQFCPRVTLGLRHHRRLRATAHSKQNSGIFRRRTIKPPGPSACRYLSASQRRWDMAGELNRKRPTFGAFAGYKRIYSCTYC